MTFARFIREYHQETWLDVLDIAAYPLQQSQRLLQRCRDLDRMHVSFVESNALQTPFSDGCFDWIETDFFLQFFSPTEKEALFREWYRLLKPGGIVTTRDWLQQKDSLLEQCIQRMKSWLVRHTLGPVTYSNNLMDVQKMLYTTGFEAAFFPEKLFHMRLPLLTSILLYKSL
jgi:ubiquinone/menaquinone biosynthesis C-methylase UbiE